MTGLVGLLVFWLGGVFLCEMELSELCPEQGKAQEGVCSLAPAHLERCRQVQVAILEPTACPTALQRDHLSPCSNEYLTAGVWGVPGTSTCKELCEGRTDSAF